MKRTPLSLLLAAPLFAGTPIVTLDVPNTFTAGSPAVAADVNQNFTSVENAVNSNTAELERRIEELTTLVQALQARLEAVEANSVLALDDKLALVTDAVTGVETARFSGINVQVVNGIGSGSITNDSGNLIVGYNTSYANPNNNICTIYDIDNESDCIADGGEWRTGIHKGSHNLIVGFGNNYNSVGSVIFGNGNGASAYYSTVLSGTHNIAFGSNSAILGGIVNRIMYDGRWSTIAGGSNNTIETGTTGSIITGGSRNQISGGSSNAILAGSHNTIDATTNIGSIAGGTFNEILGGNYGAILGGRENHVTGDAATVSGGYNNSATNEKTSVSGGAYNTAAGSISTVSGGYGRSVTGEYDWVAGSLFETE